MAITLQTNATNAAADAVCALLDGGTIDILTSADAVIGTLTFGSPAFAAAVAGVATANDIGPETSTIAGTATKFTAKTSLGAAVFVGTITTVADGSGDMTLTSVVYADGEQIKVNSMTYTQPAS